MTDSPAFYEERIRLLQAENQRLRDALETARPYVYSVLGIARSEAQPWRAETAKRSLQQVDTALDAT